MDQQSKDGSPTRYWRSPNLILWTQWATVSPNILSVSHLKPRLRYVGDSAGFEKHHIQVVSMTYLNPRFVRLNGDITHFPTLDLDR